MTWAVLGRRIGKVVGDGNVDTCEMGDWEVRYDVYWNGQQQVETRNGSGQVLQQQVWGRDYIDELVQVANYPPNQPVPAFARARQRRGPHRCWFTRTANGHSFACGGESFGRAFARSFLRRGAKINTSPHGVTIYNRDAWLHRNDWGFGLDGDVEWFSNIDEFLTAPGWVTIWGKL